ncbi:hypothetical protein H0H93_015706 [Arthromyces matolae]|nr:hypothetical protein H0H93_015706 [Arthromyces matolae]
MSDSLNAQPQNKNIVEDKGLNSTLPDGTTLEVGEMINPETGNMTSFEEIWRDEEEIDGTSVLFLKNLSGTAWQGRVGSYQMALGRAQDQSFWAWQAKMEQDKWVVKFSTSNVDDEEVVFLPTYEETVLWEESSTVSWAGEKWVVLERN